jgi:hypothetical protein
MPDHDRRGRGIQRVAGPQNVFDQGKPGGFMEHFWEARFHARPLARGEHDEMNV